MKKYILSFLLVVFLLGLLPQPASAQGYDPTVKVGLYYDSAALVAANLQNVTGMQVGYSFGYYDGNRNFVSLYEISRPNQITVLKNTNLWRSGNTYSDMALASYQETIGAYCLQIDSLFTSAGEAESLCEQLKGKGLDAYLCAVSGGFRVRIGKYLSSQDAENARPAAESGTGWPLVLRSPSQTCYTVVETGTSDILFQMDMLGSQVLGIQPWSEETWFKGNKYRGGFEYNRVSGNNLTVINVLSLTDYIKGVIPVEVSPSWPLEAQKAQALCAKCYTLHNFSKHQEKGFDLCNTTDCQVYGGTGKATDLSNRAVDEVSGLYVLYQGEVCETFYHASSGGYTEDARNIWNEDIPYLKAVEDIYLENRYPYTYTLTLDQISWILKEKRYITQNVTDLYVSRYSDVGNVLALSVVLENGQVVTFSGDRARTALNSQTLGVTIGSHRYTINGGSGQGGNTININGTQVANSGLYAIGDGKSQQIDLSGLSALTANGLQQIDIRQPQQSGSSANGVYVISGTGSGHNIGMSQWGAYAMAKQGFTCEEIIRFYFTGVTVEPYQPN